MTRRDRALRRAARRVRWPPGRCRTVLAREIALAFTEACWITLCCHSNWLLALPCACDRLPARAARELCVRTLVLVALHRWSSVCAMQAYQMACGYRELAALTCLVLPFAAHLPRAQVFEFCDTDLKKYMDLTGRGPSNPLPHRVVQSFMYQLCKGLAHLHSHGVMHRDLKCVPRRALLRPHAWRSPGTAADLLHNPPTRIGPRTCWLTRRR